MRKDALDGLALGDDSDDAQPTVALRTFENKWQSVCATCYLDAEVTVFGPSKFVAAVGMFMAPGQPNGPSDPREGLLLLNPGATVTVGEQYTIDRRGKKTASTLGRTAGGGAHIVHISAEKESGWTVESALKDDLVRTFAAMRTSSSSRWAS